MKAPPVPVASRQAGGGAVVRLLTGENRPGFCKLSKSRIDRDRNGREYVGRLGASAGAGWGACWPGAVLGWPFGAGFGLYMTLTAKRQASGHKSSSFRPFSLRASLLPLRMSSRSPAGRAGAVCAGAGAGAGHGRRSQAKRLANQQNAQRFNKKCSIMTKMMGCILYFLRYKYVCFGVK